jgi:hypothetical protein
LPTNKFTVNPLRGRKLKARPRVLPTAFVGQKKAERPKRFRRATGALARKVQRGRSRRERIILGGASGIADLGKSSDLSDYLKRVKTIREEWGKKAHTWDENSVTRKGEEEQLWFRGQPAEFGLSPKLHRKEYKGAAEEEIRLQFQRRALQLMQARVPDQHQHWDWYFLMQHYGAPTRLLEWTDNQLVGLFFGITDERNEGDAAVWILDPYWLNHNALTDVSGPLLPDWKEAEVYLKTLDEAFGVKEQVRKESQQQSIRRTLIVGWRFRVATS